jgi:ABC-type dipeptide/oligopeptide/nickel transport system permease subunit
MLPSARLQGPQSTRRNSIRANPLLVVSGVAFAGVVLLAIFGPLVYPQSATRPDYSAINAFPTAGHPLGTDNLGRDTLARLLSGLRVSLIVAFYVELLNIALGATLGLLAGFYGGLLDVLVSRVADILFAFPGLLLAILIAAVFGPSVTEAFGGIGRLLLVAGSLSLVSWPLMARLVRSRVLVLREQDFVLAARSLGASQTRIILRHLLPSVSGLVIAASTLDIASVVVNEAVLSLLGLGIQPPGAQYRQDDHGGHAVSRGQCLAGVLSQRRPDADRPDCFVSGRRPARR